MTETHLTTARALVLAGGALILAAGLVEAFGMAFGAMFAPGVVTIPAVGTPGTLGYAPEKTVTLGTSFYVLVSAWLLVWSLGPAIALFWSASRVGDPRGPSAAGSIAIVAGALSLLSGGGFVAGAVVSIVGGAMAVRGSGPPVGAPPARPA